MLPSEQDLDAIEARAKAALALASKATEGPWDIGVYDSDADPLELIKQYLSYGQGDVHSVWCPTHPLTRGARPRPDHAVLSAITGNGPDSEANAAFIAASRTSVPDLATANIALVRYARRLRKIESIALRMSLRWDAVVGGDRHAQDAQNDDWDDLRGLVDPEALRRAVETGKESTP